MSEQTIKGYKCPIQLFLGDIKPGDLYVKDNSTKVLYIPIKRLEQVYRLPAEIVEAWEPCYTGGEKIFNLSGKEVKVNPQGIYIMDSTAVNGWTLDWLLTSLPDAKASELQEIINYYNEIK